MYTKLYFCLNLYRYTLFSSLGPLAHLWTMRYEAKHSYFKGFSSRISYKNVALSLAKHHQRWVASNVAAAAEQGVFFKPEVLCSKKGNRKYNLFVFINYY